MALRKASKKQTIWKILLTGPSGSGKTNSGLILAKELAGGNMEYVALIEAGEINADHYTDYGIFNIFDLKPPFHPNRYVEAINECVREGMRAIVIDGLSAAWEGQGGLLDLKDQFQRASGKDDGRDAWGKIKPFEQNLFNAIKNCPIPVICTCRVKTDYWAKKTEMGKAHRQKIGLKPIQRDGIEHEFDIHWCIEHKTHKAVADKDRSRLFINAEPRVIDEETAQALLNYNEDAEVVPKKIADLTPEETLIRKELKEYTADLSKQCQTVGIVFPREKFIDYLNERDYDNYRLLLDVVAEEVQKEILNGSPSERQLNLAA